MEDDVRMLKLITGEIISTTVLKMDEEELLVKDALMFNYHINSFVPYDEVFEENEFKIKKEHILRNKILDKNLISLYKKAIDFYGEEAKKAKSVIQVPDKKIIK